MILLLVFGELVNPGELLFNETYLLRLLLKDLNQVVYVRLVDALSLRRILIDTEVENLVQYISKIISFASVN